MEYSGRTSAYVHKFNDWKSKDTADIPDCIQQHTIFEAQWTNCPVEVEDEVKRLWTNRELGNDKYYTQWDDEKDSEDYPIIAEYLRSRGITKCLIHWWW